MLFRLASTYVLALSLPVPAAVALALLMTLESRGGLPRPGLGWIPAISLALGLAWLEAHAPAPAAPAADVEVQIDGWVASRPEQRGRRHRALLEIESLVAADTGLVTQAWAGRQLRVTSKTALPAYGTRCRWTGTLRAARGPRNFHAYDEREALQALDATAILDVASMQPLIGKRGAAWRRELSEPLRQRLLEALHATLAPRQAGLLAALILGIRDGIEPDVAHSWRALGLSHVLAISGMHVGLVAAALLLVGGSPRRRRGCMVLGLGLPIYAALGGLGPTVLRASLMALWGACAMFLGRERRALLALGLVSFALVVLAPERRQNLGLQLSFLATLGILIWAPPLTRLADRLARRGAAGKLAAWGACSAGIGIAAQMATLPLVLWQFGFISSLSVASNLILVPLANLALILALLGTPLQLVSETLGRPLLFLAGATLQVAIVLSTSVTARVDPRVFVRTDLWQVLIATCSAAAALAAGLALSRGRWRLSLACAGLACSLTGLLVLGVRFQAAPVWGLDALDVGQGDALVLTLSSATWVIDVGNGRPFDHGEHTVLPYLRRQGIERVRGVVLSHPHEDHCGGAAALLAGMAVDTLYIASSSATAANYVRLQSMYPELPIRGLSSGERLQLAPDYVADVLWPERTDVLGSGANGLSVVLWARGGTLPDLLAMGDLEDDGEALLLQKHGRALRRAAGDFLILKTGHHGSVTSSTAEFLDTVAADLALISVGEANRYGHPSLRTLESFRVRDIPVLRTDQGGAIRLRQRGRALWIERPGSSASLWTEQTTPD